LPIQCTKNKVATIVASFREQQESRHVLEWAISHGIGNQHALAMWKRYSTEAVAVATNDPYELTRTIPGFTFPEVGIPSESTRVSA
jgi:exodeoxyribonuclease V alpha subunit